MSTRAALAGAVSTAVVIAALGNSAVNGDAEDADTTVVAATITGFADWDMPAGATGEVVAGTVLRLALTLVLVAALCAFAGRARSRVAGLIGGWGALVVASGIAGAASYAYLVAVPLDGRSGPQSFADGLVSSTNVGAAFGLWTGWLVGMAVAVVVRPVRTSGRVRAARSSGRSDRRIVDPPAPWWAPTHTGPAEVRPGPTVFPPGGLPPPRAAATFGMTTRSGDPHPSDPDASQPGTPLPDPETTAAADVDAEGSREGSSERSSEGPDPPNEMSRSQD